MRDLFDFRFSARMSAEDEAEVMLYGEIINNMPEDWKWDPEDKSAADFNRALKEARAKGAKRLLLRVNSPGGYVHQAVAMRGMLQQAGFEEIVIRVEGLCASAATMIASIPEAKVQIFEGAEYMIHNPWTLAIGGAAEMEAEAEHLRGMEQSARAMYMKKTGQDEETVKGWMDRETWFSAADAVKYGFADELLESGEGQAAPAAAMAVTEEMISAMRGMYRAVPEMKARRAEAAEEVSSAGEPAPENTETGKGEEGTMEIGEITREQLMAGNRDVYEAILREGADAERARIQEIDDMTLPGYEQMAAEAKQNGTGAMAFYKEMVKASRQKGRDYLAAREQETAKEKDVKASAAEDDRPDDEAELKAFAQAMGEMAKDSREYDGMF